MDSTAPKLSDTTKVGETRKAYFKISPIWIFLIFILLWTSLIFWQTWNIQHSEQPFIEVTSTRKPYIKAVTIKPSNFNLRVGDSKFLEAKVDIENQTKKVEIDKTVKWISMNRKVAQVDLQGKVTAINSGTAEIKASSKIAPDKTSIAYIASLNQLYKSIVLF